VTGPMSTGSARESFAPIGSNLPDFDNYFCRDCRRIVHVRKGSPRLPRVPDAGVYAADRVRRLCDGGAGEGFRPRSGHLTVCARR
jgi:hypothetical protein